MVGPENFPPARISQCSHYGRLEFSTISPVAPLYKPIFLDHNLLTVDKNRKEEINDNRNRSEEIEDKELINTQASLLPARGHSSLVRKCSTKNVKSNQIKYTS